jgi:hypothetical protein
MFVLVLAANLFADAVRDAFDPRLRDSSAGACAHSAQVTNGMSLLRVEGRILRTFLARSRCGRRARGRRVSLRS